MLRKNPGTIIQRHGLMARLVEENNSLRQQVVELILSIDEMREPNLAERFINAVADGPAECGSGPLVIQHGADRDSGYLEIS